jgi:hypothetical protein
LTNSIVFRIGKRRGVGDTLRCRIADASYGIRIRYFSVRCFYPVDSEVHHVPFQLEEKKRVMDNSIWKLEREWQSATPFLRPCPDSGGQVHRGLYSTMNLRLRLQDVTNSTNSVVQVLLADDKGRSESDDVIVCLFAEQAFSHQGLAVRPSRFIKFDTDE